MGQRLHHATVAAIIGIHVWLAGIFFPSANIGNSPLPKAKPAPEEIVLYAQKPDLSFLPKSGSQFCIYADLTAYRAYLFRQDASPSGELSISCLDSSLIACGKPGTRTPLNFLAEKTHAILYPDWTPTDLMKEHYAKKGIVKKSVPPNTPEHPHPSNPCGTAKIVITTSPYAFRMHGTDEPEKISAAELEGANISSGCIRTLGMERIVRRLMAEIPHDSAKQSNGLINIYFEKPFYVFLNYRAIRKISVRIDESSDANLTILRAKDIYGKASGELSILDSLNRTNHIVPDSNYPVFRQLVQTRLRENSMKRLAIAIPLKPYQPRRNLAPSN